LITPEEFDLISQKHGGYASWAVWAPAAQTPTSSVGDLRVFDFVTNPTLLRALKRNVVMVGLNISRPLSERFRNFHDPRPEAKDFKIRYAFTNTAYYGAYMTEVIKNIEMVDSKALLMHLRKNLSLIRSNIDALRNELHDLGAKQPLVLAFGAAAHQLLAQNLEPSEYSNLVRLTHYSHYIPKERYREQVLAQIQSSAD
jgi:hypothetical protein